MLEMCKHWDFVVDPNALTSKQASKRDLQGSFSHAKINNQNNIITKDFPKQHKNMNTKRILNTRRDNRESFALISMLYELLILIL